MAPNHEVQLDGHHPMFFTDYTARFNCKGIYRLLIYYKENAGIKKPGGGHVYSAKLPPPL